MVNIIFRIIRMHHDLFNVMVLVYSGFEDVHLAQSLILKSEFVIIHLLSLKLAENNLLNHSPSSKLFVLSFFVSAFFSLLLTLFYKIRCRTIPSFILE